MRFDKKKLQNIEYILPLIMLALFLIGIVAITIATANPFTGEELTFSEIMANLDFSVVGLQGAFFAVGLVVMVLIMLVNYRLYAKIWYAVLAAGVVLLLLVVFFGKTRGGTQGWIYLNASGSITFQPSELVKLAMILVCAKFMADRPMERFVDVLPSVCADNSGAALSDGYRHYDSICCSLCGYGVYGGREAEVHRRLRPCRSGVRRVCVVCADGGQAAFQNNKLFLRR